MIYYSLPLPFLPHAAARPPRKAEALQGSLGAARFSWALGDDEGLTAMGPNQQGKPLGVLLHLQVPKCHLTTPRHRNGEGSPGEGPQLLPFPVCSWRAQDKLR